MTPYKKKKGYDPTKDLRPSGGPPSRPISGLPKASKAQKFSAGTDENLKTRRVVRTGSSKGPTDAGTVYAKKHTPAPHTSAEPKKTKRATFGGKESGGKIKQPKVAAQGNWNTGGGKTVKKNGYQYREMKKK